jgi:molybdenum cofactor cytidylyltransferase
MNVVILAAGRAQRMGRQKLLLPIDGRPMLVRVIDAAAAWPTVVVAAPDIATVLRDAPVRIVRNESPERGMTHSLRLANEAVPIDEPMAVLLGDLPDITRADIARVIAAYDESIDIVVPRAGDLPAHPVVFGPFARTKIAALPDGDTLRDLRDDPSLRRRVLDVDTALADIDTPEDYASRATRS